jgi:ribosomal subunit interface protein
MKNFTIFCKDFELTEAIQAYAEEKMAYLYRYLNYDENHVSFNFRLGKISNSHEHGKIFFAEVSIHTPEKNYGGRIEADDVYAAIDLLKDELSGNITHYRDKTRTLDKKAAQKFKEALHIDVASQS